VAEAVLEALAPEVSALRFMDVRAVTLLGQRALYRAPAIPARTGSRSARRRTSQSRCAMRCCVIRGRPNRAWRRATVSGWRRACASMAPMLDETTTPVEAALDWTIGKARRPGGERSGGFSGAEIILRQLGGSPAARRICSRRGGRRCAPRSVVPQRRRRCAGRCRDFRRFA